MFDEISLSGEKAIKLLLSDGFPSDNRFGLRFYDGNEAGEDEAITSFDDGYICTPTRRYPFSWLRKPDAELIITSKPAELETFLASLSTPFENRMNSVNMRLQAMGFPVAVNTTTLEDREFVLRLTEGRGVPSLSDRSRFFEIAKASTNLNWCSRFFEEWWKKLRDGVASEPEAIMHLAYVFRNTARYREAIKITNVVEFGADRFRCSPKMIAILSTQRAATFLDIFERHGDPELLRFAKGSVGKAWQYNTGSLEASAVYQRLDKLKRNMEEESYKARVDQAYADWADWT